MRERVDCVCVVCVVSVFWVAARLNEKQDRIEYEINTSATMDLSLFLNICVSSCRVPSASIFVSI